MNRHSLQELKILIARPRPQAERISSLVEAHGGTAVMFPVIEITRPDNFTSLDEGLARLNEVDLMMLVSVSAVNGVVERLDALNLAIPEKLKVAAIGPKTAQRCESCAIKVDFVPSQRVDSEGLLECMSGFSVAGKQTLIFRGQYGRELLKTALEKLGATVSYAECYQTRTTTQPIQPIIEKWARADINAVLITSVSILERLIGLLGPSNLELLKQTPVITISDRIANQCTKAGIRHVVVSDSPADDSVLEKLQSLVPH